MVHVLRVEDLHVSDEGRHNKSAARVIVNRRNLLLRPREPETPQNFEIELGIELKNDDLALESLIRLNSETK